MLLGRDPELARIADLLAAARAGDGAPLVVRGEAGIGKTALLETAQVRAAGDMRVLGACGLETEAQLPFAALAQLLDPLLDRLDALPQPQAAALAGALALGPPAPGDRFAVCVATLGLLRDDAERQPVLLAVDDAQWLDPASAECLAFAARRLAGTRIAMLLALRDGVAAPPGIDRLPELRPAPLDDASAERVVAATAPDTVAHVRAAVVAASAGNPLALCEVARALDPDERGGRSALVDPIRPAGRLALDFAGRLDGLTQHARDALVVVAAAGGIAPGTLRRACTGAGLDPAGLAEAEAAGIVRLLRGRLDFVHPLARSAAYHRAPAPLRRRVHRALAALLDGDRRAWHLAAAAEDADEETAQALQQAGVSAADRRAYVEAALAHARAAELTADPELRARRLLRACNGRVAAGQFELGQQLLDRALADSSSLAAAPRVLQTQAVLLIGTGRVSEGFAFLQTLAAAAASLADPPTAAHVTADAGMAALIAADMRATAELGERAAALIGADGDPRIRAHVLACLAAGRVFTGDRAGAEQAMRDADPLLAELDPLDWLIAMRTQAVAMHVRVALEQFERARAEAAAVLDVVDRAGALTARVNPLSHAADAAYRLGAWQTAWQESAEAADIAGETGSVEPLLRALMVRARLAAARGLEDEVHALVERVTPCAERFGIGSITAYANAALAFLDLGAGRVAAATARLERLATDLEQRGVVHPTIIPWRPDLCEAYAMAGRRDDARRQADALTREAELSGGPAAHALAARCRALCSEDDGRAEEELACALAHDAQRPMPFERARTLLVRGESLHRARRRAEARAPLREAETIFASLGATPWQERAAAALRAAGAIRRPVRTRDPDALTAQEIRVATTIARGLTKREAAAELFLSPKTVDFHLQQIYAKLAIRSRAQLAVIALERGWMRNGG